MTRLILVAGLNYFNNKYNNMKKLNKQIIDIARFIFEDSEYKIIEKAINNDNHKNVIGFIDEQIELYEILLSFENDKNSEIPTILDKLILIKNLSEQISLGKLIT